MERMNCTFSDGYMDAELRVGIDMGSLVESDFREDKFRMFFLYMDIDRTWWNMVMLAYTATHNVHMEIEINHYILIFHIVI